MGLVQRVEEMGELQPSKEWPEGVFAKTVPAGVDRKIINVVWDRAWGPLPYRLLLIIEDHGKDRHVCIIPNQANGQFGMADFHLPHVAEIIFEEYGQRHRSLSLYLSFSVRLSGAITSRLLCYRAKKKMWGEGIKIIDEPSRPITPLIRKLAVELDPKYWIEEYFMGRPMGLITI